MSERLKKIEDVFNQIRHETPSIDGLMIVTNEGLPIYSQITTEKIREDKFAASSAVLTSLGERAVETYERGSSESVVVKCKNGFVVLGRVSADILVSLAASKDTKIGVLLHEMARVKKEVAKIFVG